MSEKAPGRVPGPCDGFSGFRNALCEHNADAVGEPSGDERLSVDDELEPSRGHGSRFAPPHL
jgi:hypothetical protein